MEYNSYEPKYSSDFKKTALDKLRGNWLNAVLVCIIFTLLLEGVSLTIEFKNFSVYGINSFSESSRFNFGSILALILGGPLTFGLVTYFLNLFRDNNSKIEDIFDGFSDFGKNFVLYFIMCLFIVLWTLLLIIPGIIASIRYSMSFYILHDYPELSASQALDKSKEIMDGEKERYFMLWLSFLGWFILGVVTLGIGFIWITPYYTAAKTAFYEDLKIKKGL